MIKIGVIRNLALIGFSFAGESGDRFFIYNVFDMESLTTFCMIETVEDYKPTEFLEIVGLMNSKKLSDEMDDYYDYLPMHFSVATVEGEITKPDDLIVIGNPEDIDSEMIEKGMNYLKYLKK